MFNATQTFTLTERFVASSDGTQIFAQAIGNPVLPSIVFVHGFAVSALVWASILSNTKLLKYFQLVAYDLRGHGRSGKPDTVEGYTSKLVADDFAAVTNAFNATKPIYVGWSMGGTYVSDITTYYGEDALSGIVFTAAVPYLEASGEVLTEWVKTEVVPGIQNLDNSTLAISSRVHFNEQLFNHPEKVPAETLWSWLGGAFLLPPTVAPLVTSRSQNTTNLFTAGAKGLPVLVINGEEDRFIVNDEVVKAVEGKFKDLKVHTVKNGSHALFYEDEEEYVEQVLKFARRVVSRR